MRKFFIISALLLSSFSAQAQNFDDYFEDKTLRLDYTFAGDATRQQIFVDELVSLPRWYGRKQHLAELPLKGNGQITVRSLADGMVIYRLVLKFVPGVGIYRRSQTNAEIVRERVSGALPQIARRNQGRAL